MGMLDRYRKTGGFLQLVMLLETSPAAKQEKFLALIREESPAWEGELKKRLLSFERVLGWNPEHLGDIWPRLPDKVVATAVWTLPAPLKEKFMASISVALKRRLDEAFTMNPPTDGEVLGCQLKILQEIRTMTSNGLMRMDKLDPELVIPDGIEGALNDGGAIPGLAPSALEKQILAGAAEPAAPAAGASPAAVQLVEEMKELRRKLLSAAAEIQTLKSENQSMKERLEQIRKIA